LGDIPAVDAEMATYMQLAEEQRQPFYFYIGTGIRAMWALLEGLFADSEQQALYALALGRRVRAENAEGPLGLRMFTLRRE
jgi:hypothetical protein